jgi:hypothetical protein
VRRFTALLAALTTLAIAAPAALADSIVYEKDGNVWLANPDGSGQRQVTTSGGYSKPTQSNDGTIVAVKDSVLHRLNRAGTFLNLAAASGTALYTGPIAPALAPDGSLVAYDYNNTGPSAPGFHTTLSYATRQTTHDEIYEISGRINPSWLGNNSVLMFDGSPSTIGDTLIKTLGVTTTQPWYEDPDLSLSGGEVDASMTRLAATDTTVIRLYQLNSPPPSMDVQPKCDITGPAGSFFRPTWSPNGTQLAWQEDNGIWVGTPNFADCGAATAALVIPGGKAPDWGPADVGAAGGNGGPGPGPNPNPGAELTAKVQKKIRLAALLRGLKVRVNCQCRVTATLSLRNKRLGQAKKTVTAPTTLKVKPTRKGKARLRRGGKSVKVVVAGGGRFLTRKVKVVR